MRRALLLSLALFSLIVAAAGPAAQSPADRRDELARHRNLGKAFYENPTTHQLAVDELKKALDLAPDSARERVNYGLALLRAARTAEGVAELERAQQQDPRLPHTWFSLGIVFKKGAQYEQALAQFQQMVKLVPDDATSHYNLGYLYKITDQPALSLAEFELAAKLDPNLAGPHFQLFNAYRDGRRAADAAREQATFQAIKRRQAGAAIPEDLDWSAYAEILDPIDPNDAIDEAPPATVTFADTPLAGKVDPAQSGLLVLDADADGRADLLVWSADGVRVFLNGTTLVETSGLEDVKDVVGVAAGDYNNDGFPDLVVLTRTGSRLYTNAKGRFSRAAVTLPERAFTSAVWVDYDHDYDADLLLLGERPALLRNNGRAGFSDQTADFPFVSGHPLDARVFNLVDATSGHDVVVTYADHGGVIYRDKLAGKYEAMPVEELRAGARGVQALDLDADGSLDLVAGGAPGLTILMNRGNRFEAATLPLPQTARAVALADLENRGTTDVLADGVVLRNRAAGRFAPPGTTILKDAVALVSADFDNDGRTDVAAIGGDGALHLFSNRTATPNSWTRVSLTGVKNAKLAPQAQIEVKSGARYQKKTYDGVPVVFGLAGATQLDTVRITWPNGLIQNELRQPIGRPLALTEAPRLSGSCPMIFAWNGRGFQFITDVLGVAPLGASSGDGTYFPVDHDEYVQIPGEALAETGGEYEIRVTEELREVSYLDQLQLIAVDHPARVEIFTNDKFKSPPFPEFRLFGSERRVHPLTARDDAGHDVRAALMRTDRVYPQGFSRDYAGVAAVHVLDLDFGTAAADNRAVLILNGWVDWADGSTFMAASQADPRGLMLPSLQVKDALGRWTTVVEDMGMPAGKPKTIAVDLTGKFLSSSREVRIVTNLCIYWDEIFLSENAGAPRTRLTHLDASSAQLHYRGFSTPTIHPARTQPESFDYARPLDLSMWNPTPGLYTRYGDVLPLVTSLDDRLAIMGSGDELVLRFPAATLPPLDPGWRRDFLLLVDGWAKDADANTAFPNSVDPLPFHAMSSYPYPAGEYFPDDAVHRAYREQYNTRPALRLIRPLAITTKGR
jgi:tetratricopeptide (TPR) repeat protein